MRTPQLNKNEEGKTPPPTVLDRIVLLIKQAGAPTEKSTDRDGALSWHAETHALGMGISAGWFFAATGDAKLLSFVYGAAVYEKSRNVHGKRSKILQDIRQEKHYALMGVVFGVMLGLTTRAIMETFNTVL